MGWSQLGVLVLGLCCAAPVVWGQGYVNIAPGKTYNQSSILSNSASYLASNAADDNTGSSFHTGNDNKSFWEVDLGRKYPVLNITVWGVYPGSSDTILFPYTITVDGQHCVSVSSKSTSARNHSVTCSSIIYGQKVRITKTATTLSFLGFSEFEILVPSGVSQCYAGRWGTGCQNNCSNNCGGGAGNNFCYQSTGQCYGECVAGRWGDQCEHRCGQNCATGNCDLKTGNCSACLPGWHGNHCDRNCSSQSCLLNTCDQGSGRCLACNTGYDGYNCTECGHSFSKHNTATCSPCSAFCNTGGCDKVTGNCTNGCVAGRWGDRCAHRCVQNCATGNCDLKTGNCSACLPGWHGNHCDRNCSSQSCLLNTCDQGSGRCLACNTGYAGYNCTGIKDESSQLSSGSVVGAILGAGLMLTVAVLSVLVFLCWKHRSQKTDQDAETVAASPLDPVTTPNTVHTAPPTASPSISAQADDVTLHEIRDPGNTYEKLRIYSNMVFDREAH